MVKLTDSKIEVQDTSEVIYADAHSHLVPNWFELKEIEEIVTKARKVGVKVIVNSVLESEHYDFGLKTLKNKGVFLTTGIEITKISKSLVDDLKTFFHQNEKNIVAIGEIGLDFHWVKDEEKQKKQEYFFKDLITFSQKSDIPIVIHSREAEARAIKILKESGAENVLMHCFDGTNQQVLEILAMDWYITVPTSTVYRKNFQKIIQAVSLDNLMFETDSPFHSLQKGEKNNPSSIPILCKHAAKILEIDEKELARITTKNTRDFYRI
ncbi:MAG: TatD family hydrolase [Candidatus Thorarchaeota archaeon]